ncbi:CapA family protein [Candidatus Bathyarchaeota archaeon]|nr:CapA family protein [Candidatus Bathyarchaeota archaeon]
MIKMKEFSLIATGDSLITLRQSIYTEPEFTRLINLIRSADCAFTNLEMNLHDYGPDCYPAAECGGTYTRAEPKILEDLLWMGFDIFSTANNHSLDYMYGGLMETIKHLKEYNVPYAGTGYNLGEARAPCYKDTGNGRVALISACSTFANFGRAGDQRRDMKGRPGLNPLRYLSWYEAKPETIEKLKQLEKELNLPDVLQAPDSYHFMNTKYVEGNKPGLHTQPNPKDLKGNLDSVREATQQADWILFTLHAHEGRPLDSEQPAEFIEDFARAIIDNGAHCFIGHGHHAMRGIEIRKRRPIFYSLGNFIFQNETVYKMPADFYERYDLDPYSGVVSDAYDARKEAKTKPGNAEHKWFTDDEKYWMSVLPRMEYKGDELSELTLHPVELGMDKPRSQRGRPMLAEGQHGKKILEVIKKLSEPYGTEIKIKDNVGTVQL